MKTQLSAFAISAMIITTGLSPVASENAVYTKLKVETANVASPIFSTFSTHRQGQGIALTWEVEPSANVLNFTIQRTYEDVADPYSVWEDIGSLPPDGGKFNRYKDDNVFPGFISYRISALMSDGTTEVSGISTEQIISH